MDSNFFLVSINDLKEHLDDGRKVNENGNQQLNN